MTVMMAVKPTGSAPATIPDMKELRDGLEGRLQGLVDKLSVAGDLILLETPSATHAHRAAGRLHSLAVDRAVDRWQAGVAGDVLPASQLVNAAAPGETILARPLHRQLAPRVRARYLPAETIAGHEACRSLPPGTRRCFVITPLGEPESDTRRLSDWIFRQLIAPACQRLLPRCLVVHPLEQEGADVWADISNALFAADHVVAYLGTRPWNPNVMVEVGYRLATGKPLVILAPQGDLPFDLLNRRTIMLPENPTSMSPDAIGQTVDAVVEMMTARETKDLGWGDLRPTATVELDLRDVEVKDHSIGDASQETADLFDLPRTHLVGMSPEDLIEHLRSLMDEAQHEAFVKEQNRLYAQADVLSVAPEPLYAEVPIFLTKHRNPAYFHRAFLPAILMREQIEHRLLTRVVYIDVSRHVRIDTRGIYKVPKPGPNLDLLFSRYADAYDAVLLTLPNYVETVATHCRLLKPAPGKAVLDLGAGTGNVTCRLLDQGASVTAVDRNVAMLERLQAKCSTDDGRLEVMTRDVTDLSCLRSESFDAVNILLVLFAVEQPEKVLREARRVLRPGGVIVVTEPSRSFNLPRVLEETERELRHAGRLPALAEQWDVVKRVNTAFRAALEEGYRAENVREWLSDLEFKGVQSRPAYQGHCLTLSATRR
ncbi:MAG TPA: class I SAM-dependent methyltransferase [Candidatus Acidoferrum sp.]|nr:class I SAM-dependent methyltransferase [Candidatus Acidoferrum sp.]